MTEHRSFKKLVRARMAKTGESYTAARAKLLAASDPGPAPVLVTSDDTIRVRTGRGWEEWFDLLDAEGMGERTHREIARWVADQLGVVPLAWPAQAVTKSYERARIGHAVGQKDDGTFTVNVSKTVAVPAERLYTTIVDDPARWFGEDLRPRTATPPRTAHYDRGTTRVALFVDAKDPAKATVTVQQTRLADAAEADQMRAFWRERLAGLKTIVEKAEV
ncbi:hypothetical protein [Actinophytocola sp.]|uniref:hypothetical protein n=1 Tax=Actinophytocola sp. TaxID=1872138 RepID=UPI002ED0CBF0